MAEDGEQGRQAAWEALKKSVPSLNYREKEPAWDYQGFNEFGEDVAALVWGLRGNTILRSLSLFNCRLGDGAVVLAEGLRDNEIALKALYLSDNQIGDAGAVAVADYLRDNTTLKALDLSFNRFGDAGAVALAERLRGNTTLKYLKLHHTRIGDAGAAALADVVQGNTALEDLQLHSTQISDGIKAKGFMCWKKKSIEGGKDVVRAAWERRDVRGYLSL